MCFSKKSSAAPAPDRSPTQAPDPGPRPTDPSRRNLAAGGNGMTAATAGQTTSTLASDAAGGLYQKPTLGA